MPLGRSQDESSRRQNQPSSQIADSDQTDDILADKLDVFAAALRGEDLVSTYQLFGRKFSPKSFVSIVENALIMLFSASTGHRRNIMPS